MLNIFILQYFTIKISGYRMASSSFNLSKNSALDDDDQKLRIALFKAVSLILACAVKMAILGLVVARHHTSKGVKAVVITFIVLYALIVFFLCGIVIAIVKRRLSGVVDEKVAELSTSV